MKRKVSGQKHGIKVKNDTDLCLKSYRISLLISIADLKWYMKKE